MIQSMTGYGKSSATIGGKTINVEIKALNSKSIDLYVRMPSAYKEQELNMRQLASDLLVRGKVDISVNIEGAGGTKPVRINKELATLYLKELKALKELTGEQNPDYLSLILRMPDIYVTVQEEVAEDEWEVFKGLVQESCEKVIAFREHEGKALKQEFTERIADIKRLLGEVEPFEKHRTEAIRERMQKALGEMKKGSVDDNRFEQELIFYIEKLDISEEKMRLSNHLTYFLETLETTSPGKKLGFITQEIGREINTLGSKSYQVDMQKLVVEMKDNLEKIKEQVLNTL